MRILHVITSLLPGGAEKLMVDLLPRFKADGIDAEIAVFNAVETAFMADLVQSGVKVHRFVPNGGNVYLPGNLIKLNRLICTGQYDIVHTHNTAPQLFAAISHWHAQKRNKFKLVTTEHNTDNRRRHITLLRSVDRWMYHQYDRIICISDLASKALIEHIGNHFDDRVSVICNGIDLDKFKNEIPSISDSQEVIITMVAGFRPQKDQDTLIRAMALLPQRYRLRLIGDGVRRPELEGLIKQLGLDARIDMLGIRSDIPDLLAESHILVLSSHYEGLSLSSVEAMASGRPLIASDVPGLGEIVGGYGVLFPEGDERTLANSIGRLAESPELYRKTALRCQQRAGEYDIDKTAQSYISVYKSMI